MTADEKIELLEARIQRLEGLLIERELTRMETEITMLESIHSASFATWLKNCGKAKAKGLLR